MKKIRNCNESCVNCSTIHPARIDKRESGRQISIICPDCGTTVVQGFIQEGSVELLGHPIPERGRLNEFTVPDDFDSGVIEIWWTNEEVVAAIHGRRVCGSQHLYNYVNKLRDSIRETP